MGKFLTHLPLVGAIFIALAQVSTQPRDPSTYSTAAAIILAALSGGPKRAAKP